MDLINYHHLRLFWAVAKEGNLTRASARLHLTPQTVSMQIRELESAIGDDLFVRSGRQLYLTESGSTALRYANEIFSLGQELTAVLTNKSAARPQKLSIGITDVLSKQIAFKLIEPALKIEPELKVVCIEGPREQLLSNLAVHSLDVVLMDGPIPPSVMVKAYNHEIGSSEIVFMAKGPMALRLKTDFPASLENAPILLPGERNVLRRDLEMWFESNRIQLKIAGEFDDTALMKTFGKAGVGIFPVPSIIADEIIEDYKVRPIGIAEGVLEKYYAISVERKVQNAVIAAICNHRI